MQRCVIILLLLSCIGSIYGQQNKAPERRSYRERAEEALKSQNFRQAADLLTEWSKAMPRDVESQVILARCQVLLGQPEAAVQTLHNAVQLGLANPRLITDDTIFNVLRPKGIYGELIGSIIPGLRNQQRSPYDELLQSVRRNAENNDFQWRYIPQTRYGRYRILYPPGYDEKKKYYLCLLLHGNGQDPGLILRWARQMNLADVIFVSPEGTYLKFRESAMAFAAKYSATGEDQGYADSLKDDIISASAAWYHSVMKDARENLNLYSQLPAILGFSQGGFYASVVATRYPQDFCTVMAICGSMYPEGHVQERLPGLRRYGLDVFLAHAMDDPVVPYQTSMLYKNALEQEKIPVMLHSFKGGHWPSEEITKKAGEWLMNHFREQP
jgi:predicted esterase